MAILGHHSVASLSNKGGGGHHVNVPFPQQKILLSPPPVTPTSFPDDKLLVIASPLGEAPIFPREYNLLVDTVIIFFRKFSLNLANFNWANQRNSR